jgi:hypothetical protein
MKESLVLCEQGVCKFGGGLASVKTLMIEKIGALRWNRTQHACVLSSLPPLGGPVRERENVND